MKLIKMYYMTLKGEKKINTYNLNIPKTIVKESGIDDNKELIAIAEENKIIIKEK